MGRSFYEIFDVKKPIIGMIHLAGYGQEIIDRALEEISIYEKEGVNGIIVENYHGEEYHVKEILKNLRGWDNELVVGINVLGNLGDSFYLANEFNDLVSFIQVDSIHPEDIPHRKYQTYRSRNPELTVLGGINFKYKTQEEGKELENVLRNAMLECEAIVTTGESTGDETPIEKLKNFREIIEDFPLIIGSGGDNNNIFDLLKIADGAIVGSYFKNRYTKNKVDRKLVQELMSRNIY